MSTTSSSRSRTALNAVAAHALSVALALGTGLKLPAGAMAQAGVAANNEATGLATGSAGARSVLVIVRGSSAVDAVGLVDIPHVFDVAVIARSERPQDVNAALALAAAIDRSAVLLTYDAQLADGFACALRTNTRVICWSSTPFAVWDPFGTSAMTPLRQTVER